MHYNIPLSLMIILGVAVYAPDAVAVDAIPIDLDYCSPPPTIPLPPIEIPDHALATRLEEFISHEKTKEKVEMSFEYLSAAKDSEIDSDLEQDDVGTNRAQDQEKAIKVVSKLREKDSIRRRYPVVNHSRNDPSIEYDWTNNYLKDGASSSSKEKLLRDAVEISRACRNPEVDKTILCVSLLDKYNHVKNFVFHNAQSVLEKKARAKACELGYDVIKAEHSHAEIQFIQFLNARNQVHPGLYTHLLCMGCSRPHCKECNTLLKLFLGPSYLELTCVPSTLETRKQEVEVAIVTVDAKSLNLDIKTHKVQSCSICNNAQEVASKEYLASKFALPTSLKSLLTRRTGRYITFTGCKYISS
ncbi:MAG: hypothetical protein AAFU83_03635 [Bacteroidota bacterium]